MSKKLDDLSPKFKDKVILFLARLVEANIPILIVETFRTIEQHKKNLAAGRSWIKRSKHCDGLAIDVCPYDVYKLRGGDKLQWDGRDPVWQKIGELGEKCGLKWGGRWKVRDMCHFED